MRLKVGCETLKRIQIPKKMFLKMFAFKCFTRKKGNNKFFFQL